MGRLKILGGNSYRSPYSIVVTKAAYPETEAKAEAPGFETEAEAVSFETETKTEEVDPRPRPRQQGTMLTKVTFEQ